MNATALPRVLVCTAAAWLLAACGGGGTDGTGSPVPKVSSVYSAGVMTRGSVIVNGVRYDDTGAQVIDDRGRGLAQLADGMTIRLSGVVAEDGSSARAQRIAIESALRGVVTAVDAGASPPRFSVSGVTVRVDDATVYADGAALANLLGSPVEVHGLRDASGVILASRIERQSAGAVPDDELRGAITTGLVGRDFSIGPVVVSIADSPAAVFSPAGCDSTRLVAGRVVEVHGAFTTTNRFRADRIECEDLYQSVNGLKPGENERYEIEGLISALDDAAGRLRVGDVTVSYGASTQFRNGSRADLANGVQIEADGQVQSGVLVAREISFKRDRVILQGVASDVVDGSLRVLGVVVRTDDVTEIDVNGGTVSAGDTVQVRGSLDSAGTVLAEDVRDGSGSDRREIVQARVTAKTASSITLLGLSVELPAGASYQRSDGTRFASREQFLAAIVADPAGGSLVKVRGEPLATAVEEAELQY